MAVCPNCKKTLVEDAKFCDACGTQVLETMFCPNCGEKASAEHAFCQKCGASLAEEPQASQEPQAPQASQEPQAPQASAAPQQKKERPQKGSVFQSIPKKAFVFGGLALAVILVVVLIAALVSSLSGGGGGKYSLYLKDDEICYTDFSGDEAMEITSRLLNGAAVSDAELANAGSVLGSYVAFSADGKRIFFPDRVDSYSGSITLYYRDISKPDEEPVKIDSDVMAYAINPAGTCVVYLKGEDGILYRHDLTDKEKIASNVEDFDVTEDCNTICYLTDENGLYLWSAGKDEDVEKIASDITRVEYASDDLSVFYYIKDGALYQQAAGGGDKKKIASDVSSVACIYPSGEVYYTKAEPVEINLMDYVSDELALSDASMAQPVYPTYPESPEYPYWRDYATNGEYEAALDQYEIAWAAYETECDRLYAEYEQAYSEYSAKLYRDSLREELKNLTTERTEYTLYYFDGAEETKVTDALVGDGAVSCAYQSPILIMETYDQSEVKNVKLSEIEYAYEVSDRVSEALYSSTQWSIAVGAVQTEIDQTEATGYRISGDGSAVYFLDDMAEDGSGDLYKIAIANGQVGSPELFDSDVSSAGITFGIGSSLIYYKNVRSDDYKGDLYIDTEEIDYDVMLHSVAYLDGETVLYYTDWNNAKSYGTLKMAKGEEKTKIADDIHDYTVTNDGDILYLYDYSLNYYKGTLYRYNNGEPEKIDDDVAAFVPVSYTRIKGGYYYGW